MSIANVGIELLPFGGRADVIFRVVGHPVMSVFIGGGKSLDFSANTCKTSPSGSERQAN